MTDLYDVTALTVVEEQAESTVRRECIDGRWYFSVIDMIGFLTDSPNPRRYWTDLKRDLAAEGGSEVYAQSVQLKMVAADGKKRATDAADYETMLRIIQSVRSPKAEPVKRWLAKIGAQQIEGIARPAIAPAAHPSLLPMPALDAPALDWAAYHDQMASLYRRAAIVESTLADHDQQLGNLNSRLEGVEEGLRMLYDQIGPATLSPEHLSTLKAQAKRLHETTGTGYQTIYWELCQHFHVSKIEQIPADSWSEVMGWFMRRIK
jgi:hypothetical protein